MPRHWLCVHNKWWSRSLRYGRIARGTCGRHCTPQWSTSLPSVFRLRSVQVYKVSSGKHSIATFSFNCMDSRFFRQHFSPVILLSSFLRTKREISDCEVSCGLTGWGKSCFYPLFLPIGNAIVCCSKGLTFHRFQIRTERANPVWGRSVLNTLLETKYRRVA